MAWHDDDDDDGAWPNQLLCSECRGSYYVKLLCIALVCVWSEGCSDVRATATVREHTIYDFGLNHDAMEATKSICCLKDKGALVNPTVTRWL